MKFLIEKFTDAYDEKMYEFTTEFEDAEAADSWCSEMNDLDDSVYYIWNFG